MQRGFDSFFGFLGGCEDHVTQRVFGRVGETPAQTVARWRRGYCGAALRHGGFMAPWAAPGDPVRAASPPVGTLARVHPIP